MQMHTILQIREVERTGPHELAMELHKVLALLKYILKKRWIIICGCLINTGTVSGKLATATYRHFGTLISS